MRRQFDKQVKQIKKDEYKLLNKKENPLLKASIEPVADKIQSYIPGKLKTALEHSIKASGWFLKKDIFI